MRILLIVVWSISYCIAHAKPIILWDLHGVLFHQKSYLTSLMHYPHLSQLLSHVHWPFIKDLLHAGVTNIEYLPIEEKYHNPYLQNFLIYAANNVTIIPPMKDLVFELAHLGYEQQIASNIGPKAFAQLINPHIYPEYASFFALFNLPASQTGCFCHGIILKKPNAAYFDNYLQKNNLNPLKQHIIFIDDVKANILTARALGFDAILFKHPYQLRTALRERGIPVAPPPHLFSNQQRSYIFTLPYQKKVAI